VTTAFGTPGVKTVAIRVIESGGGFAIKYLTIVVNAPPQASFTVTPTKPVEGNRVTFASTATDPDGPLAGQQWDLDNDGQFDDASGAVASTTRLKRGNRTVKLRVTDSKGAAAVATAVVPVKRKPLKAPVDVKRSLGYVKRSWGVELVVLIVKVPSKTTVKVSCNGRGCPRGTLKKRSKSKKGAVLRFTGLKGSVRAGAKISVVTTRPGHITAYDTYLVRGGGKSPLLREGCKPPGSKKVRALRTC
jgi:PKD repeat protein